MSFEPKLIFLADDDDRYRERVKKALVEAGHSIVIEVDSGKKALSLVDEAVSKKVQVAVLDGYMPDEGDGNRVASELNRRLPNLIVVSIATLGLDVWKDPNFDETKPYHPDLQSYDINGRQKYKGADFSISNVRGDYKKFAQLIGETDFTLKLDEELATLPEFLEFIQSGWKERK